MGILSKATDNFVLDAMDLLFNNSIDGLIVTYRDQYRLWRELRKHGFEALHFHRKAELVRKGARFNKSSL